MDNLKDFLDEKVLLFNQPSFIDDDPISIPHRFSKLQDIEISGFFAAILAWGQRKTIINKSLELMDLMGNRPYDFVLNHSEKELKQLMTFKHRTFNDLDTLYFIDFFSRYYRENESLEKAFTRGYSAEVDVMEILLSNFHDLFFDSEQAPRRTRKHIASPKKKSACKRINMFLRWMVRRDDKGVDFGLWNKISPAQLVCPCDLHVDRIGRSLGLIQRKQTDWQTAMELTRNLRLMDAADPIKYDFALFGLGVLEKEQKNHLK
ncbi:TIGR02757 family protein [Cyclobacterium marinum]|uniref:TIGR02757 family protein n=1 Tax=Cyclobacterium marinum TaxID=104 RepID=UPI0011EEC922|nr:TIGR02757 family protein [Cyclobacterium marinum]MBI0401793.1 TIGR02757 family protein [Cyclobacterium marinum]